MDRDVVIQKFIVGKASQSEKDWLLGDLLKFYNSLLILLRNRESERRRECEE